MAGEDYTSPITGLTYKVPKYEEPADAPVAFKDFADSITVGGPASRENAVLQALEGDSGLAWAEGMALSVVDAVPADTDGEIGDVVFVTGPGDGGSPGVGGGKVLQVVRGRDTTRRTTTNTSFISTGLSVSIKPNQTSSAVLLIFCGILHKATANESTRVQIVDSSNNPVSGAADAIMGSAVTTDQNQTSVLVGYATPSTTNAITYTVRLRSSTGASVAIANDLEESQLYAIEVAV